MRRLPALSTALFLATAAPAPATTLEMLFLVDASGSMDSYITRAAQTMEAALVAAAVTPGVDDLRAALVAFQDAQSGRNEPDLDPDDAIPTIGSTVRQQMTADFAAVQAGFEGVDTFSSSNEAFTAVDLYLPDGLYGDRVG